jgi:hypothetical protein
MKNKRTHYIISALLVLLVLSAITMSCNKALEVTPKYILNEEKAFENDSVAALQLAGIYSEFANSGSLSYGIHLDLSFISDDMEPLSYLAVPGSAGYVLYNYQLRPIDAPTNDYWTNFYRYIYYTNSIIAGVDASTGMTAGYKKQCKGEALAWRAFFYYYLASFYGPLPYVTDGNYAVTSHYTRTGTDSILSYCMTDLKSADSLVSEDYPTTGRFHFNRAAVNALLARVALAKGDYQEAINAASLVLNDNRYALATLHDMFNESSTETIMQLWNQYSYTFVGQASNNESTTYGVTHDSDGSLYSAFDENDARRDRFIKQQDDGTGTLLFVNNKYLNNGSDDNGPSEYLIMFRLDEVLLNRAEAYARLQQNEKALDDANQLRRRAGIDNLSSSLNGQDLTDAIIEERRKELCFEWADRWLSLKRNKNINTVLGTFKQGSWNEKYMLFPIPLSDIKNSSLIQNPGY